MSTNKYQKPRANDAATVSKYYAYADKQNRIIKERLDKILKHINREHELKVVEYDRETELVYVDYQRCLITTGNMERPHRALSPPKQLVDEIGRKKKNISFVKPPNSTVLENTEMKSLSATRPSTALKPTQKRPLSGFGAAAASELGLIDNVFDDSTGDESKSDDDDEEDDDDDEDDDYNYTDLKALNYKDDQPSMNLLDVQRSSSAPLAILKNRQKEQDARHIFSASPKIAALTVSRLNSSSFKIRNFSECQRISRRLQAFEEKRASAKLHYAAPKNKTHAVELDQRAKQKQWAMAKHTSINYSTSGNHNKTQGGFARMNSGNFSNSSPNIHSSNMSFKGINSGYFESKNKNTKLVTNATFKNASFANKNTNSASSKPPPVPVVKKTPEPDSVKKPDSVPETPLQKKLRKRQEDIRRKNELVLNDLNEKVKAFIKSLL
jgi:hypothetical protein